MNYMMINESINELIKTPLHSSASTSTEKKNVVEPLCHERFQLNTDSLERQRQSQLTVVELTSLRMVKASLRASPSSPMPLANSLSRCSRKCWQITVEVGEGNKGLKHPPHKGARYH